MKEIFQIKLKFTGGFLFYEEAQQDHDAVL
jgi:hypothetical protein